jgi:hypothetical protein
MAGLAKAKLKTQTLELKTPFATASKHFPPQAVEKSVDNPL